MTSAINIVAVGARTPLGLQSTPTAAAVRAGVIALKQHPFMVDRVGDLMPGAIDYQLDPRIMGSNRMLLLAESALREVCAPLSNFERLRLKIPVYLGLPELRPGFDQQDATDIRNGLARIEGLAAEISEVKIFMQGHAAGLAAFATAVQQIRQGMFEVCLIGGVESYFQPDTMEWLDANRQLANMVSRSGFVPGEGAGFCLLMNERVSDLVGLKPLTRLLTVAVGRETKLIKTPVDCLGEGLTATVKEAVTCLRPPAEKIADVICDINGERYRSEEWGFVCLRLSQYFDDPTAYKSPSDCWGDMGAASGVLFAMLVCQAAVRGYNKGPRTLLWSSSENGLRAAVVLETSDRK